MRVFAVILYSGIFVLSSNLWAASDCKTHRGLSFAEQVARLDPKLDLDLVDLDFFSGGGAVAGYEYRVKPAYTNGLYSRSDSWQFSAQAVPGKLFEPDNGIDFNLGAGFRLSTEATFIRFVKDPCLAMTLKPYSPRRMPLRAKVAIGEKFNVGDYFLFRGSTGFIASAEILSMISSSFWGVGASGHYLLEGFYQLHIVRLDENRIRMKVLGHRGTRKGASLNIGWHSEFDVFQIGALNNGLEKIVNTTPVKLKADKTKSNIFMLDYILDLSDQELADAFDKVLADAKKFKQLRLTNPFRDAEDITGMLLLDLSPLEDLFQEDRRNNQVGRLKRNLRTSSSQKSDNWGIDIGNRIFGFEWDKENATSYMGVRKDDNTLDRYLLRTWATKSEGQFFYSWSKASERSGTQALFKVGEKVDEVIQDSTPINIVSYLSKKRNRISYNKFQAIKMRLKKAMPLMVFNSIPWESWGQTGKDKFTNFGLRYDFVMSPEAIRETPELSANEIGQLFTQRMLKKGLTYRDYFTPRRTHHRDRHRSDWNSAEQRFNRSLRRFSNKLQDVLDQSLLIETRLAVLHKLRENRLFKESGLGFIMSLLPDRISEYYHLDLNLSSNEAQIDFNYGDSEISSLYKKLITIKAALDDDALDILREAESLSRTK